ncbi:MAG TPA: hypothetical protein VFA12_05385 [Stellaceae bacterium]|nr:hypothetical protein [Stellaceae bacterium]
MTRETISLGGTNYAVPPLRLGQLRLLLDALDEMAGKSGGALVEAAAKIIHAGLLQANPQLTLDDVLGLTATIDEVNAAVAAVIRVAGLKPAGEAAPVAAGSATSTPPSPPAAAIPTA